MPDSKVAVLKTSSKTVLKDYARLMHLAEYQKTISKKYETILKLNLSWSLYYPACSTEPWQLEGVVKTLKDDGYRKITPVENKTVVTNPWKGVKQNKWAPVFKKYGLKFTALPDVEWITCKPKGDMLVLDEIFDPVTIPKMFCGKNIIHLPTVKTHGHSTTTGAMKNAFGGLLKEVRHHCHAHIHEVLVDLLTIQKEIHEGIFAVMDGTVCGDGAGPRTMEPRIKNYILASDDQVAIDAISAKMMGFDPMKIKYIKLAHDRGLGIGDPKQIDILGEDISKVNFKFKVKKSPVIAGDQLFRKGPLSFVEPLLFHTWFFNLCIIGSATYHDYYWYNFVGRKRITEFMKTEWGQLFKRY